ncbi:unnamed protein product [Gulo gulo]|uniref:Uncharacterized protein n=1 Tax=Gulo gulo TaxID=48420 RepID=A0A9X9M058_GULGU|nr:unnamed protein product [Gulo gulo]
MGTPDVVYALIPDSTQLPGPKE